MGRPCKYPKKETFERITELRGQGLSFAKIGALVGYTKGRVCQICQSLGITKPKRLHSVVADQNALTQD